MNGRESLTLCRHLAICCLIFAVLSPESSQRFFFHYLNFLLSFEGLLFILKI